MSQLCTMDDATLANNWNWLNTKQKLHTMKLS